MRITRVTRNTRRQATIQNINKLKNLHVILCDIALYPELIPFEYKERFKKQLQQIKTLSCKTKNYNIQLSKHKVQKTNIRNGRFVKGSSLKNTFVGKSRRKHEKTKSKLNNIDIKSTKKVINDNQTDEALQLTSVRRKLLLINSSDESSDIYNYDPNKISHTSKNTVLTNAKIVQHARKPTTSRKSKLESDLTYGTNVESAKVGSDGTSYLDKKNLIFIDCNSKNQEVSSKEELIASTQYNSDSSLTDFINGVNHRVRQKCNQNKKSLTLPNRKGKISTKKSFKKINVLEDSSSSDDFSSTSNKVNRKKGQYDIRPKINNEISTKKLFKKIKTDKISEDWSSSNMCLSTFNNEMNGKEDQHTTKPKLNNDNTISAVYLKSTAIVPETEVINHYAEDNLSKTYNENKLTTANLLKLNETYRSEQESISKNYRAKQNECSKKNKNVKQIMNKDTREEKNHIFPTEIKSIDASETSKCISTQENNTWQDKNALDNDRFHNKVLNCEKPSSLMTTKNYIYDININDSKTEALTDIYSQIQKQKHIAEESTDVDTCAKRIKLNTIFQQSNKKLCKSLNQQFNDSTNTNTMIKDTECNKINKCNEIDLCKTSTQQKAKEICISKEIGGDKTINNAMEVSNKNNTIITHNENEETSQENISQRETSTFNKDVCKKQNAQISSAHDNVSCLSASYDAPEEALNSQTNINTREDTNAQKKSIDNVINDNGHDNEDDDDCISLFANETFDEVTYHEEMFQDKQEKLPKPLQSDTPYIMSTSSFDKYIKQSKNEFNKEYERCMKNNKKKSQTAPNSTESKTEKREIIEDNLPKTCIENKLLTAKQTLPKITQDILLPKGTAFNKQILYTNSPPANSTNLVLSTNINMQTLIQGDTRLSFYGFCFNLLTYSQCNSYNCGYKHDFQNFINIWFSQDSYKIMSAIKFALFKKFYFFCQELYKISLKKFSIDQILVVYQLFYNSFTLIKNVTRDIIKDLLWRQISLKDIVDRITVSIKSSVTNNETKEYEVFECLKEFIKPGEYWYVARNMVLILKLNKHIVENILYDCIHHEKLSDIHDINNVLISKLHPDITTQLNKHLLTRFKSLLNKNIAKDTCTVESVQDFGENLKEVNTIASPDSQQMESPANLVVIKSSQTNTNEDQIVNETNEDQIVNETNENQIVNETNKLYILHPIDDLPEARSAYRNHEHLWKFYVDLERLKKGLEHEDYDYVIGILEKYAEKQDDFFVRSCCNMLRTEVKRTDQHIINIIQRTVQTGTFAILRRILFSIGIDILVALMDVEAWRLAFHFVESLKICDFPSAEFTMLSTEIYLANKKTLEALNLFKNQNMICTSRAKWYVASTVHDEYIRNKLMYILLDSLCNSSVEHAFFLFTFLLRDQSSQFYPIDLSRYVNKLTVLLLSKNETALIMEMGNLILKYNFPLNTKTCRALITTTIHTNEKLAVQLYYYAEAIGYYPTVELWPITHVTIHSDLTEEEIYLVILHLLEKLKISFGHTIEYAKSRLSVFIVLEVKSAIQFPCATQQTIYNKRAITSIKTLVRNVLKTQFDPPILLKAPRNDKICKLQNKSLINYLKSEHCN